MTGSTRSTVKRGQQRAAYDQATIYRILDENLVGHVGFVVDEEATVIPMAYIRIDDALYLHGNRRNRMMNALLDGQTTCISVTRLDGLVLARSGFHHSVNYESVVVFGRARQEYDKVPILDAFVERLAKGRSKAVRAHTEQELNATLVVRVPIEDASAKLRSGAPVDDEADYELDIWAGVLPIRVSYGALEPCPRLAANIDVPDHLRAFVRN